MSAAICLEIGAVGQRDLDLKQDVAVVRNRVRDLLEAKVARGMEDQCPHAVKTTFAASRRR